ncbi:MerR family transcriptional regulator [Clostridium sp. DL1XJH146]
MYKVKEVADVVGISVRTLHHYDKIGLLKPESINEAGYRLYSENDLIKLQQVLFFKELDFKLEDIKIILNDPKFDREGALKTHKEILIKKKQRLEEIIKSVDTTLSSIKGGIDMSKKETFEPFDMREINDYKEKYAEEVKAKYDKKVVDECNKKTAKYSKNKWQEITEEGNEIYRKIAAIMEKGPKDEEVQKLVAQYRKYISDNFYTFTVEIFRGLGDLYVCDDRFTKNIDKTKPGLAEFLKEAMHFYCDNQV